MKKTFDCVEMKRRGAEALRPILAVMTPEEELAYWQRGTKELQQKQRSLRVRQQVHALSSPELTPNAAPGNVVIRQKTR